MSKGVTEVSTLGTEIMSIGGGDPFSMDFTEPITKEVDLTDSRIEVIKPKEIKSESKATQESKSEDKSEILKKGNDIDSDSKTNQDDSQEVKSEKKSETKTDTKTEATNGTASYHIAKSYQKEGLIPEDVTFSENITAKELKKLLISSTTKDVEAAIRSEYENKYGEDRLKTAELLLNGIDPEDIKEISAYKRIASAELGDDDESNLKIKEAVIRAMYQDKGLSEKRINKLVEDALEEDEGESEFQEGKKHFSIKASKMEADIDNDAKLKKKADRERQESIDKEIKSTIKSGDIYGTKSESEKKKLESFLYDQDEVIKVDGKTIKVTGFYKALHEYNNDIKKQITFAKLLMDGFDLSSIEEMGKSKASDELDNLLEGHVTNQDTNKEEFKKEDKKVGNIDFTLLQEI